MASFALVSHSLVTGSAQRRAHGGRDKPPAQAPHCGAPAGLCLAQHALWELRRAPARRPACSGLENNRRRQLYHCMQSIICNYRNRPHTPWRRKSVHTWAGSEEAAGQRALAARVAAAVLAAQRRQPLLLVDPILHGRIARHLPRRLSGLSASRPVGQSGAAAAESGRRSAPSRKWARLAPPPQAGV